MKRFNQFGVALRGILTWPGACIILLTWLIEWCKAICPK